MKDKICIVTGANSGIGKVTTLELAKMGARLLMICRNTEKAEQTRKEIAGITQNQNLEIFQCDFASQKQIRRVSEEIKNRISHIDVLVNNAGFIANTKRELTEDGLETTFAVNHLGYFMLTNLLKEPLLAAPAARVVNVSSEAHRFSRLDLDNLQLEKGYSSIKAYALSKLLNILFTRELAKRTKGTSLTANCLHPGGVATNFSANSNGIMKYLFKFGKPFLISPGKGAETSVYLATSPLVREITGEYFANKKIKAASLSAFSESNARKVWEISMQLCRLEGDIF